ncbi:hypothetical protein F5Y02DRAFT_422801 [Annulohypoxylon stygium]|nr:hypothetical protein F5Y02DRAFT_422801 [Annulohypoxylon stygium]
MVPPLQRVKTHSSIDIDEPDQKTPPHSDPMDIDGESPKSSVREKSSSTSQNKSPDGACPERPEGCPRDVGIIDNLPMGHIVLNIQNVGSINYNYYYCCKCGQGQTKEGEAKKASLPTPETHSTKSPEYRYEKTEARKSKKRKADKAETSYPVPPRQRQPRDQGPTPPRAQNRPQEQGPPLVWGAFPTYPSNGGYIGVAEPLNRFKTFDRDGNALSLWASRVGPWFTSLKQNLPTE